MDFLSDADFIWTGFNLAVMLYVVYDLYQELGTLFIFVARSSKGEGFLLTFVNRPSSQVYFVLLLASAALIFVIKNSEILDAVMLIAPVSLLIGFFVHSLTEKLCFITESGLGSVTQDLESEIRWQDITEYSWKENVLSLKLNRKWLATRKIRFSETSAMVLVNERLKHVMDHR